MRQYPRVLRPSDQDSPSRRNSRKENYASYRAHAALSKGSNSSSISSNTAATSMLLKKKPTSKDSGPSSSSLLVGSGSSSVRGNIKIDKLPSSSQNSSRDYQPLKEVQITDNHAIVAKSRPSPERDDYTKLSWKEKENYNLTQDYSKDIHSYLKKFELVHPTAGCLSPHKVTHAHRARMIDWMIEVLTNFKCEDQTFFLAVQIMDRYFKEKRPARELSELHVIGVTSMFLASKMEDIYPLRMSMVFEKIGHKKLPIETIKNYERDILASLDYTLNCPTSFDFLRAYLKKMFPKEDSADRELIDKMAIYLAKMNLHDYDLCTTKKPSLLAVAALYVSLKICEQLRKMHLIDSNFMKTLIKETEFSENDIVDCAQRVLYNAQNFETLFSGLENLKKIHFVNLSTYLKN